MFDADRIRDIAIKQLAGDPEAGAALSVFIDGEEVVGGQWGLADAERRLPYDRLSIQYPMSASKGVAAAVLALLIDRGQVDPDERVAHYWPEFGTPAKRGITVSQLFSHQAGLPLLEGGYSLAALQDRDAVAARLAAQDPLWEPGTQNGYHCWTYGNYTDIFFEKATGKGLAGHLAELRELLDIEIHFGLPREYWDRAVWLLFPPELNGDAMTAHFSGLDSESLLYRMITNFPDSYEWDEFYNGELIRLLPSAADHCFCDARSLAKLYAFLASGGQWQGRRLCSAEAVEAVTKEVVRGADALVGMEMAFGLGFQKPSSAYPFSPNPNAFGHAGAGGAIAFGDPDAKLGFAFLPSRFAMTNIDPRWVELIEAVYEEIAR